MTKTLLATDAALMAAAVLRQAAPSLRGIPARDDYLPAQVEARAADQRNAKRAHATIPAS
eukprot:CAMPEP_0185832698 /NCGR_PEP_ID=MMETSP1353-20130828/2234_1 /TAXON_ID=1077150 /ORGANISM="Erythrolobus australicus, Strain CCMP3124" /LENGTH=59 /DNA_ID=CAMNT_0028530903 /DNA_START=551 /DNA_END=731 /DNA_ORIENTATION=-